MLGDWCLVTGLRSPVPSLQSPVSRHQAQSLRQQKKNLIWHLNTPAEACNLPVDIATAQKLYGLLHNELMNAETKLMKKTFIVALFLSALVGAAVFTGCSLSSADSTSRSVSIIVQGYYQSVNGTRIVQNNTGAAIKTLDLRQNGDQLEAVDNNGMIFRGSIGRVEDTTLQASFVLTGATTAGQEGTMAGVIAVDGNTGRMQGTWAEPSLFSTFSAIGTVPQTPTNSTSTLKISSGPSSVSAGSTNSYSVTGSSGTITWDYSGGGSPNPETGTTTTLIPTSAGTLTASDSNGGKATLPITLN